MTSLLLFAAAVAAASPSPAGAPAPAVPSPSAPTSVAPALKSKTPLEVRVLGGDLLAIGAQPIRLFGVAAPDASQYCTNQGSSWPCGDEATAALRQLVSGQNVSCQPVAIERVVAVGQPDRVVARCLVGNIDLGADLVARGLAVPGKSTPYMQAALEACMDRKGIWRSVVESPWTFRARHAGYLVTPMFISRETGTPCLQTLQLTAR